MPVTTWWGLYTTASLILVGGVVFYWVIVAGHVRKLNAFKRWTIGTAIIAAILILLSAIPVCALAPNNSRWTDAAIAAGAIGPLALTVSVTLASIFYSAGDWYETAQRFRLLGIVDAKPDRRGRQSERAAHWQNVLRGTRRRIVISGTTLGGWFATGWEETRESLLTILPRADVQVLLADPTKQGFQFRADDPGEAREAEKTQRARPRAKQVYQQIAHILEDGDFRAHIKQKRLSFYVYAATPLSVVWVDDDIYFATYLPFVSDSACPEFAINRRGIMGGTITVAIEELLKHATKIETASQANDFVAACGE